MGSWQGFSQSAEPNRRAIGTTLGSGKPSSKVRQEPQLHPRSARPFPPPAHEPSNQSELLEKIAGPDGCRRPLPWMEHQSKAALNVTLAWRTVGRASKVPYRLLFRHAN